MFNSNLDREAPVQAFTGKSGSGFLRWAKLNPLLAESAAKQSTGLEHIDVPEASGERRLTVFGESGPDPKELIPELVEVEVELGDWGNRHRPG